MSAVSDARFAANLEMARRHIVDLSLVNGPEFAMVFSAGMDAGLKLAEWAEQEREKERNKAIKEAWNGHRDTTD